VGAPIENLYTINEMKECIFCGTKLTRYNKSKEHIISQWIMESLKFNKSKIYGKHTSFPSNPETIYNQREFDISSFVFGNICKFCNNGWMSELENSMKPLLLGVLDDRSPTILSKEQCLLFSKWAYKTAIIINYSVPYKKIIPISQVHNFYLKKELPSNFKVDLAFCQEINLHWLIGGNKVFAVFNKYNDLIKSYIITIQLDHLLIRTSWTPLSNLQVLPIPVSSVYRIHPQENDEQLIQVIRGGVFRDIEQFHFIATIIAEDDAYAQIPDIE
jgi:hypothetical protein